MSNYDAVIYASNAKYMDGVTHSMPVDTVHTLGSELYSAYASTLFTPGGVGTATDNTGNSITIDVTTGAADRPWIKFTMPSTTISTGEVYKFEFDVIINSGIPPKLKNIYLNNGSLGVLINELLVTGTTVSLEVTAAADYTGTEFGITIDSSAGACNFDINNVTVKEITLPTASYIQYLAYPSLTWKQLSSTVDYGYGTIPVSTTWPLTESFQVAITSDAPLIAADLLELNADKDLMFKVWDDGYVLSSGYSAANIVGFLDGTSGDTGHKYVQDINVALGVEEIANGGFDTDTSWTKRGEWIISGGVASTIGTTKDFIYQDTVSEGLKLISFKLLAGAVTVYINGTSTLVYNGAVLGEHYIIINSIGSARIQIYNQAIGTPATVDNVSVKEVSAKEIANFTSNVNTNYLNGTTGATNLKLIKDASGRTTGTAAAGTTQWAADGRSAVTGWTITTPFTITEVLDGVTYTWHSDGNYYIDGLFYGTYTVPTGVWTFSGNLAFDGVTTVSQRGIVTMVPSIVAP